MQTGEDPGPELRAVVTEHVHGMRPFGAVAIVAGAAGGLLVVLVALFTGWSTGFALPIVSAALLVDVGIKCKRLRSPRF